MQLLSPPQILLGRTGKKIKEKEKEKGRSSTPTEQYLRGKKIK
jgi:hypothetical protein